MLGCSFYRWKNWGSRDHSWQSGGPGIASGSIWLQSLPSKPCLLSQDSAGRYPHPHHHPHSRFSSTNHEGVLSAPFRLTEKVEQCLRLHRRQESQSESGSHMPWPDVYSSIDFQRYRWLSRLKQHFQFDPVVPLLEVFCTAMSGPAGDREEETFVSPQGSFGWSNN